MGESTLSAGSERTSAHPVAATLVLVLICLAYVIAVSRIAVSDWNWRPQATEQPAATRDPQCPCKPPDDSALSDNLEQVKLLFDYTKFHISVYTTLAGFLLTLSASSFVKTWELHRGYLIAALFVILGAGVAAGVVAASMPQSTSKLNFWAWRTGPYDWPWLTIRGWTRVEHTSFWTSAFLAVGAFFAGRTPPDELTMAVGNPNV
jgi:hypothetical protein